MADFITDFRLPDVVYHGTTMGAILNPEGMRKNLINSKFLQKSFNKDFGTGLYTTIDLFQATRWPRGKFVERLSNGDAVVISPEDVPAVVQIKIDPKKYQDQIRTLDFRGGSMEWSNFILTHRFESAWDKCLCEKIYNVIHPQIVCGPMADNDAGDIIQRFRKMGKDILDRQDQEWFQQKITESKQGAQLDGLELGDQIAFLDERLNTMLEFDGYYKINLDRMNVTEEPNYANYRLEWDYYDKNH